MVIKIKTTCSSCSVFWSHHDPDFSFQPLNSEESDLTQWNEQSKRITASATQAWTTAHSERNRDEISYIRFISNHQIKILYDWIWKLDVLKHILMRVMNYVIQHHSIISCQLCIYDNIMFCKSQVMNDSRNEISVDHNFSDWRSELNRWVTDTMK